MSRRFIAFIVVLVIGLQGPILAFEVASATAAAHCCPGNESGNASNGCSSCPAGVLAGSGCAVSPVFTAMLNTQISLLIPPLSFLLPESDSVSFVTEIPAPQFRPPIV